LTVRGPLEDITIVAVEQYGAGPFGSVHLADLGAEVIKIEDPSTGGDVSRYVPPHQEGEDSLFFETFNRNKRSLSLDLQSAAGRTVFEDLVARADAVYSNLRGDVPARLRLRYDDLKAVNPKIVCCCISGYGMTGSYQKQPGYDYTFQGLAGWMSLTGEPDGPPAKSGLSLVDFSAGYVAALALLSGIHAASRDGKGMDCDICLYDVAVNLLSYLGTWYLTAGYLPTRKSRSAHPSLVPFQNFPTATGWMVVGCAKEKFWKRLVEVIDRPDLDLDERFSNFEARGEHSTELIKILDEVLITESTDYWVERLEAVGVPCAPVLDLPAALEHPLVKERGLVVETEHPRFGKVLQLASPVRVGEPRSGHRRAPQRNEDAEVLFERLGYDEARIRELKDSGAFGSDDVGT